MSDFPELNFHFKVDWGGTNMGFSEVSGLDYEAEVLTYRTGAEPSYTVQKIPGLKKFSNVIFKRGVFRGDNEYYQWWNTIHFEEYRRDMVISLLNENHEPVIVWKLKSAWPVKIQSTHLKANSTEIAIETMEIAHEGLIVQNE